MKRLITYLCSILFLAQFSFSQTAKIAELTFETAGGYNTNIGEHNNLNSIYFIRTDGSDISPLVVYSNLQGSYFFGAQNVDDEPDGTRITPQVLTFDDINISGYTNLEFRVHLAEASDGTGEHWDENFFDNDYVHINYDIDNSGSFNNLLWVEAAPALFGNQEPRVDTDFNGDGDGVEIINAFTQFTRSITGTGLLLDIQIAIDLDKQYEDIAIDNIEIWGDPPILPEIDWCNIQSPTISPQNIDLGATFDVYAQVYEPGITDSAGEGTTIDAWIGYNTTDNDPEANDATWTWIPASYNTDSGNNDEYVAEIGSGLPIGTYYYASRFTLNGGSTYMYGGTGGIWNNDSVELIVNSPEVDWCNLQFPPSTTISFGDSFDVFGQVYEAGITDTPSNQGAGIIAWIGYSETDATTTTDFTSADWTWITTIYNPLCGANCGTPENNDEYYADLGAAIPGTGTYYYVTRFQFNGGSYTYGGYNGASPLGGFWDGITNISQILTVNSNCSSPQVTWDSTNTWSGTPDLTTEVIIDFDYDMTTLPSFSACSLIINAGVTLTIDDNKYVEVNNNIINNGSIIVRSNGSVLQHNDNATVSGIAMVEKTTAILNNWYEYTYWSSPVVGETIETALSDSSPNRRFWFDAINFIDAQMESNNDNNLVPGQDDIDDDANDWQPASGIMISGVGYAATHSQIAFTGAGNTYKYIFNGAFNNGVVSVPAFRNDTSTADLNWNFIGNPYPSAIDADLFFSKNKYDAVLNPSGILEGAIYLWSQNTQPSDTNNGNEGENFSNSDYAIINGVGENPGGDASTPNRYIPSGQGFFTVYSNDAVLTSDNVVFNNSMRVSGNNDQFFRMTNSTQPNKLSIKLTSENGIFNQMLVGYVDGATSLHDGMYYDAPRNLSTGSSAIIYSTIEGTSRKFAIQGKDPNSLNSDEVIILGFKNTIEADTHFMLSIANLEGEFMNSSSIYLRDNMLNLTHDLSTSSYTFTSNVGEFNDRFEIHFSSTLTINESSFNQNELIIAENNELLNFSTTKQSIITNIQLYDMLGRLLLDVDYNDDVKTIRTLKMNTIQTSILIVNVTLADGNVLTKKVLKQ